MNISIDDLKKLDIRIGRIITAEKVENADRLLRLDVDFGSERRQIVSGVAQWYTPESLISKECPFILNLPFRKFRGVESQGMLMAVGVEGGAVLLHPDKEVPEGAKIV